MAAEFGDDGRAGSRVDGEPLEIAKRESKAFSRFVDEKSRAGDFQSQGHFTLAEAPSLEKLARHTLAKPSHWVLKMVQAATAAGATSLRFFQQRDRVRVEFVGVESVLPEALTQRLSALKPRKAEPFLDELVIGLRPFLTKRKMLFRFGAAGSLQWVGLGLSGVDNVTERFSQDCAFGLVVFRKPSRYSLRPDKEALEEALEEARTLRKRLATSPLRVSLDGQLIRPIGVEFERRSRRPKKNSSIRRYSLAIGALTGKELESAVLERTPIRAKAKTDAEPLESDEPFLTWPWTQDQRLGFSFHLARMESSEGAGNMSHIVREGQPETFSIQLARLGVICGQLSLKEAPLGGCLQIPAPNAKSDVSGLAIEVGKPERALALAAQLHLEPILDAVERQFEAYKPSKWDTVRAVGPMMLGFTLIAGYAGTVFGGPAGGWFVGTTMLGGLGMGSLTDTTQAELRRLALDQIAAMKARFQGGVQGQWKSEPVD